MLGYVDSLCAALLARNQTEIWRLLSLSFAAQLPRRVHEEAVAIAKGRTHGFVAPVHALQFYYRLTHLIDETTEIPDIAPMSARDQQMDLTLRAANE